MSAVPLHPLPPRAAFTTEPIFRLTVDQYHQLIDSGTLTEDDPVELLEGILVFKMPKNTPHATCTKLARREVERLLPDGWHYQTQDPITLADGEPEPDGAVVRGRIEDYAARHPGPADVPLVIEVSDASLGRDRGIKLRSYARAGLTVYWIVNPVDRQVEVYTSPMTPSDGDPTYAGHAVYRPGEAVPLNLPGRELPPVPVAALLPPAG
ncbi:MAG: hypothetical protein AVDCRST_MAG64-3882 [uncultured Phycisphaerae bacterium]|uniref:Putative restriction endonuclease domain-containing protein n=1 Tax=uncultured Phycisphaerae bacterium TaxID=904963 RepID=A0A6J4Q7F9_9BACT|nr:MAG: hypothetical protein AVDCRST_MAG64-3882 [uncultured Phycisphaerae bacterium]